MRYPIVSRLLNRVVGANPADLPESPEKIVQEIQRILKPLLEQKIPVKTEPHTKPGSAGITYTFKEIPSEEKKSIWSDSDEVMHVSVYEVLDQNKMDAVHFSVEYHSGNQGTNANRLVSITCNPNAPKRPWKKGPDGNWIYPVIADCWEEFKEKLAQIKPEDLGMGSIKGPAYWND